MAKQWLKWLEVSGAPKLDVIVSALLNGELDTFHDHLYETIIKDLSFNDVGGSTLGKRAEAFYYAYLMGWLAHARYGATSGSRNCIPREVDVKVYKKCDGKWVSVSLTKLVFVANVQ
ncbi:10620_t:CDS:2 [Paraglomus brasilianum]|uniref:10620_t:CDS:1 n=1 Tax=Paraglomus brasilianum TaxID=144538 RepID=A0A9N9C4Y2_9GLOM|nr:10620_t:CDS:2 [Paraglomus brasilianum]